MQDAMTSHSPWRQWIWSVGLALALVVVSLFVFQTYRTARRADAMREFLAHAGQVLSAVQHLETVATRMEANQRGFLIIGTKELERARESDFAQVQATIAELQQLLGHDRNRARHLVEVEHALQRRHARMQETSGIVAHRGLVAARAVFDPDSGFEPVRQRLAVLREEEQRRLMQFSAEAGTSARHFDDVLTMGSVLALVLLLASGIVLWRQMRGGENLRARLAQSGAMQRAILESAGLIIIATNRDGLITVFNHAARDALGYEPQDLVGKHDLSLFHLESELRERAEELTRELGTPVETGFAPIVTKARRGGVDVSRWTYVRRDGSHMRVQLAVSAVRDPAGTLQGYVGIAHDVTEHELAHERLRQSEQRVRSIIETASDAFIAINTEGVIEDWNAQAERMLGWSRHEAIGRHMAELIIPERHRAAHEAGLRRYLASGHGPVLNRRVELSALDRSGHDFPIEVTIWPMQFGKQVSFNAFVQDITERKASQDAIRTLNAELRAQAEQLAQANRELESFSYSVSHDLRAPLRHMSGYAQILREEAGERLDAPLLRYLDEIAASARHMGALIDDLLAFSRLSRQAVTPIPVDMNVIVAAAMAEAGLATNPSARIDVGPLPAARGDPVLLRQVWVNLLSNAVKYSAPRGADARIRIEGDRDDHCVRYRVCDNGVGFDPRYANKLFGVFQRLHPQDEFEGTGVGLAIVQRIIARHSGHVTAHSVPGEGAEFTFELPMTSPEAANA